MALGIKDKVAIIGMGCTRFGERWDMGGEELMVEAFTECLDDAGIEKKDIQAAWLGTCMDEVNMYKSATPMGAALRLPHIAVTRVENFCATGTEAFRAAVYAVASGAYDICLAMGVEKVAYLPQVLVELVANRAEGNPYYIEEMIKVLLEDGVILKTDEQWLVQPARLAGVRIPLTLTGVIQSRLDALPSAEREVLQRASILGRLFWDEAVAALQDAESPVYRPPTAEQVQVVRFMSMTGG